jgi:Fur family transcriptional regulator, ferric uptake regulator
MCSMSSTEAIERTLSRGGYRLTAPRRRLVEAMQELGDHFVAEDVLSATPRVGRATVFRTLRLLQDLGVVCQVVLDDGTVAYRLDYAGGHHHHLICSDCGMVEDFTSGEIEQVIDEVAHRKGFEVDAHRLELYGRCAACTARSEPSVSVA